MYSTKEAAARLGLSQAHVKLLARKGLIEAKKVGRDWVVLDLNYTRKRRPKGGGNKPRTKTFKGGDNDEKS
ncbi:helix-turn-helix domain-containing protein [Chloroflexota bacterium]